MGMVKQSRARIQSIIVGLVWSELLKQGYIRNPMAVIIATWMERCTSVTGGPKAAVYRWYPETSRQTM